MHTPDGGSVSVQCVHASSALSVPNLESPVRGTTDNYIVCHLTAPDSTCMSNQCAKAFTRHSRPHLQCVVIASRHNSVSRELEASDHMVIVTLQHLWTPDGVDSPVHLNVVLPHEAGLPGRVDEPSGDLAPPPAVPAISESSLLALLSPQQVILRQHPPVPAGLGCPQQVPWFQI